MSYFQQNGSDKRKHNYSDVMLLTRMIFFTDDGKMYYMRAEIFSFDESHAHHTQSHVLPRKWTTAGFTITVNKWT